MSTYTLSSLTTALASRLNEPTQTSYPHAQLVAEIQNALRFWNALTGDAQSWYKLQLPFQPGYIWGTVPIWTPGAMPSPWFDLNTLADSPRYATLTDQDVYSWMQWALLEPQNSGGLLTIGQFQPTDAIQSLQDMLNQYLMRTGCTSVVSTFPVTPGIATYPLASNSIQPRRGYWLTGLNPVTEQGWGTATPLMRADEMAVGSYQNLWPQSPGDPLTYLAGTEPPYMVEIQPPPAWPGNVELLSLIAVPTLISGQPTTLQMPGDFVPALMWGALADLLDSSMETQDSPRAAYARQRFEQFIELQQMQASVLSARVAEQYVAVDAVETLDAYQPTWRTASATPPYIGLSGKNLVAYPSVSPGYITLLVVGNAPVPVADTDTVSLGADTVSVILDYAQHTASFKMGGEEFLSTMPLLRSIVEFAAHRNSKVRALSIYRDTMFSLSAREDAVSPSEVAAD